MTGDSEVWLVTGGSRGFGKAIAEQALQAGKRAIATFRDPAAAARFTAKTDGRTLGVVLDLIDFDSIGEVLKKALERFGRIDVLVNNAGGGLFGAIEEVPLADARSLIDVNLFAALEVCRAVLPMMRAQRHGLILQMSSVSGSVALPGLGHYAASKFALEGASEALAQEVQALGIRVVIVQPGPFRTDWIGSSTSFSSIEDYAPSAGAQIARLQTMSGIQEGDPEKAAKLLVKLAGRADLPLRLPLGATAFARIRAKLERTKDELAIWQHFAAELNFD